MSQSACSRCILWITWVHRRMPSPHRLQIAIDLRMRSYFSWAFLLLCINVCIFCCMASANCSDIDIGNDLPRILFCWMDERMSGFQCYNVSMLTDKPWIPFVILDGQTEKVLFESDNGIGLWLHRQCSLNLYFYFAKQTKNPINSNQFLHSLREFSSAFSCTKIAQKCSHSKFTLHLSNAVHCACDLIMRFWCKPNSNLSVCSFVRNSVLRMRTHSVALCRVCLVNVHKIRLLFHASSRILFSTAPSTNVSVTSCRHHIC